MREPKRIGLREVRALGPGEIIWDAAVTGFCARRQRGAAVTYYVKYRTSNGRQRWQVIGRHGSPWTPEEARDRARRLIGMAKDGADPAAEKRAARDAQTVAQLCDAYLEDAEAGRVLTRSKEPKKASTLAIDKGRIERHIKPLLGSLTVAAVTRDDIERFLHDVAEGRTAGRTKTAKKRGLARVTGGRTAATRAVGLLGAIFTYAVRRRIRPDNPAHGAERFADRQRIRGDAAFGNPEMYEYLEAESIGYAIRLPANRVLQDRIGYLLTRPVGRPPQKVRRYYASFSYRAQSWNKSRHVVVKVEWHPGELYPRVGFIVSNLPRSAEGIVAFYNQRGTCEQHIKEGKNAIKWTRLSCRTFAANAVRLQLHALAYNLGNLMRTLAMPETAEPWSLTSLREKLIKIGAKVVSHGRYVTFQMAEVAVPRQMFADILGLIARLRAPPAPA